MSPAEIAAGLAEAPEIDRLATQVEAMRAAAKGYRDRADRLLDRAADVEAELLGKLAVDSGEVAVAHSTGRVAFAETGFLGSAAVNAAKLEEHAAKLEGTGLEPTEVTVTNLPTVGQVRDAEALLRERGLHPRDLLDEGPQGPVLRWRKAAPRGGS
jgi:hypothetical protein